MRTFVMTLLIMTLLIMSLGLPVGFVLFELAVIFLSGNAAEAGAGRILIRLAFVCGGILLIVAVLRRGSKYPSHRQNQRSNP